MPSLLETLNALLDEHDAAPILAARIGGSEEATAAAVGPALARIIDGLATLATDDFGAATVAHLVDHHDGPLPDEVADHLGRAPTESGNVILDRAFGAERGLVVIGLASALGLVPSLVGRLLPVLAPLVTAELSRRRDVEGLDDAAMADLLAWDRRAIAQAGLLEGTTFDARRLVGRRGGGPARREPGAHGRLVDRATAHRGSTGRPAGSTGSGDHPTIHLDDGNDDSAVVGNVVTLDEIDQGSAATDAATTSTGPATDTPTDTPIDDRILGPSEAPANGPADEVVVESDPGPSDDDEASPGRVTAGGGPSEGTVDARGAALAWLGWAIGAVILVLLLAWLLSTCGAATGDTEQAAAVIDIGPAEADAPAPDGAELDARAEADVAPGPVPAEPAAPSASDPFGTMVRSRGSGASLAGSVTEAELQAAVDATLGASGVVGRVDADVVTLTGSVADEQIRDGIEAGISVLLGVAAIDNRITIEQPPDGSGIGATADIETDDETDAETDTDPETVPGSEADPVPAGTRLNELLALEPVTFTSGSAELTDRGRAALDRVVAILVERPGLQVEIAGHTDDDGSEDANRQLSQERADAVRSHLIEAGVDGARLVAVGYGESEPTVPNDSLDNKAVNRRIDFVVR